MSRINVDALHSEDGGSSNIELDDSRNATCKGNLTVDGNIAVTGTGLTDTKSFRNLIINGAMEVAQRGTSDTSSGGYKTVDRFKPQTGGTDDAPTQAQISLTSSDTGPWAKGFRKAVQWTNGNQTAAGGGDYFEILYKTEGHDISSCGWDYTDPNSKITLSFWVKSSVAQNFYGFLRNDESTDKLYPFETGSLSANTWTKITKVIPGHADLTFNNGAGVGLQIHWTMFYGTNYTNNATSHQWMTLDITNFTADQTSTWYTTNDATFALTGVQLEVGDTATEFEHRSYGDELARCQRYFYMHCDGSRHNEEAIGIMSAYSTNQWYCYCPFPVTMRTGTPSLYKVVGTNYFALMSGSGDQDLSDDIGTTAQEAATGYFLNFTDDVSNTTGHAGHAYIANAAARIGFDAEL